MAETEQIDDEEEEETPTTTHEQEEEDQDGGDKEDDDDGRDDRGASLIVGLNLVLILSVLSIPEEEYEGLEDEKETEEEENMKMNTKELRKTSQRHDHHHRPLHELRTERFHTKIRDCRHSRRM